MSSNDNKPLCSFCKERSTKYSCVSCRNIVCNVCSSPANPSTNKDYDEEAKRVGVCRKCSESQSPESASASTSEPPRKVQRTISSMFGKSSEPSTDAPPTSATSSSSFTKVKRNPKQHANNIGASSSQEVRTVTASTVEKWKSDLSEYSAAEWLTYDVDAAGKARNLRCKFCMMFEDKIKGLPNYSDIYIKGSTNYRVSAVKDHAKNSNGDPQHPHTVAYGNFLKASGIEIEQRGNKIAKSCDKANTDVVSKLKNQSKMDPSTLTKTKTKFKTAYFVVKQELPISKCKNILKLESKHGVEVGTKYLTDPSVGTFIDFMGQELKHQLNADLAKAKFHSVLCDGSMDTTTVENEVNNVLFCCLFPFYRLLHAVRKLVRTEVQTLLQGSGVHMFPVTVMTLLVKINYTPFLT